MPHNDHPNKPANTLFKQQRLASWQPIMSPPHVTACFLLVAAIFIPIGIAIMTANNRLVDFEYRYDLERKCTNVDNDGIFTYNVSGGVTRMGCNFTIPFDVTEHMTAPVYLYYKITNFYQNHRRFAKSRNDKQLAGQNIVASGDLSDCNPLRHPGENSLSAGMGGTPITVNGEAFTWGNAIYNPAGLVAWSMFNDSFILYQLNTSTSEYTVICNGTAFDKATSYPQERPSAAELPNNVVYPSSTLTASGKSYCQKRGIAWDSDREAKFQPPVFGNQIWTGLRSLYLGETTTNVTSVPASSPTYYPVTNDTFFANGWYAGEAGHEIPLTTDEDLMVWMRTASLPSFRKLYRIINVDLPPGKYYMGITEQYDVSSFDGEKYFALATVSWVGGKNSFLAVAYIVVGAVSAFTGLLFLVIHKLFGDRTQMAIDSLNELQ